LFKYYRIVSRRYHTISNLGLCNIDPDLLIPFSDWAKKQGIPLVAEEFANYFTGFGYGYFDEVPTAYVMKYNSAAVVKSFVRKCFYKLPDGFQVLWEAVAKEHNVLYEEPVHRISRNKTIKIETETMELEFERLILTSPLDESLDYLDATREEKWLFSKIRYQDYRVYVCIISGFPNKNGFLSGNYTPDRKEHPVLWYNRYKDSDLYTFYVLGDEHVNDEQVTANIRDLVNRWGGSFENLHSVTRWKYFPHVTPKELGEGYFERLNNLQGEKQTYFAGELLNFSTMEATSAFSKMLIERHF
jgi:hypothetical protein